MQFTIQLALHSRETRLSIKCSECVMQQATTGLSPCCVLFSTRLLLEPDAGITLQHYNSLEVNPQAIFNSSSSLFVRNY